MERTMTIGDFVTEAAVYDLSKENFEFVKECGELQLMEIYAESVDYVTENADLSDAELGMLVTEAAAGNKEGIGAKIKDKAKKVWGFIVKLCKKVASAVVSFFGKLTRVFPKKRTERIVALENACEAAIAGLDDKDKKPVIIEAVKSAVSAVISANDNNKDACGEVKASFTTSRYGAISKFIKKLAALDIEGVDKATLRRVLGIMISSIDDDVNVSVPELALVNDELMKATESAFKKLAAKKGAKAPSPAAVKKVIDEVEEVIHKINKSKVKFVNTKIELTEEALTAKTKELTELKTKIEGYLTDIGEIIEDAATDEINPKQDGKSKDMLEKLDGKDKLKVTSRSVNATTTNRYAIALAKLQQLLTIWQESTANTINVYNNLQGVVNANIRALETIVTAAK